MAIGGDLTIGGGYNVSLFDPGTFTVAGDARPSALVVGGTVNMAGSTSDILRVLSNGYVKIGDLSGPRRSTPTATGPR